MNTDETTICRNCGRTGKHWVRNPLSGKKIFTCVAAAPTPAASATPEKDEHGNPLGVMYCIPFPDKVEGYFFTYAAYMALKAALTATATERDAARAERDEAQASYKALYSSAKISQQFHDAALARVQAVEAELARVNEWILAQPDIQARWEKAANEHE